MYATKNPESAIGVLHTSDQSSLLDSPLLFFDMLMAYSSSKEDARVLELHDTYHDKPFPYSGQVISDTIALAHLRKAQGEIASDQYVAAAESLQKVLHFRPSDLYAHYWLWQYATQIGDEAGAAAYHRQIMFFPVEAVDVQDKRLLELIVEVYPDLIKEDLWGYERSLNIARYWAWRYADAPAFPRSLDQLVALFPDERLAELQPQLPPTPAPAFQETERTIMAEMLGLSAEAVQLGPSLLEADPLVSSVAEATAGWYTSGIQAPFVAGRDQAAGPGAVRLSNLWWPQWPRPAEHPYAEYMTWVNVPADAAWLAMSVEYRVDGLSRDADTGFIGLVVWRPGAPQFAHLPLTNTDGRWQRAIVVGQSLSEHSLGLVLRNWGAANVWFRNVAVRPLMLTQMPINCVEKPCEILSPVTHL